MSHTEWRPHSEAKEGYSLFHVHVLFVHMCVVPLSVYICAASIHDPMGDLILPLNEGALQFVTSMHKFLCETVLTDNVV